MATLFTMRMDYYPFGMTLHGLNAENLEQPEEKNKYLYNPESLSSGNSSKMRKITIYILMLIVISISLNCTNTGTKEKNMNQETVQLKVADTTLKEIHISEINGLWAENPDEDASFWIKNDSMYFIEDRNNPLFFEIINDTLITYYGDMTTYDAILKLTFDSLVLKNEFDRITRLYKRK